MKGRQHCQDLLSFDVQTRRLVVSSLEEDIFNLGSFNSMCLMRARPMCMSGFQWPKSRAAGSWHFG